MLPLASAYADDLLDRFDRVATAELAHLVVGVHAQVGLWACHANVPAQAYRYLSTACEVAAAADDRPLHARALGALSYAYSSAPRGGAGGRPYRALRLLDEALAMAVGADAFTRGWLATWRADQHATLGDRAAAQADLELAWTALEVGDDGNLTGFFARRNYGYGMRGHLDSVRATVHGLAGETVQAEKVFNQVQAQAANGRRRAASYAHQALAYAKAWQPDPEAACACLLKSVDIATAEGYAMGVRRTFGVRAGLRSDWARLPCVREVDDRLRPLSLA